MHDIFNQKAASNVLKMFVETGCIHSYNTRFTASKNFYIKASRSEIQRNAFSRVGPRAWNEILSKHHLGNYPKRGLKKNFRSVISYRNLKTTK